MKNYKTVFKGQLLTIKQGILTMRSGRKKPHELCFRPPSVVVFAFNNKNQIILTREYRHGEKKFIWCLPTGAADKNKPVRKIAQDEFLEETGYKAKNFKLFFKYSVPGRIRYETYFFIAKDLEYFGQKLEQDEIIKVRPTTLEKAYALALKDAFKNVLISFAIIRLYYERKKKLKK